MPVIICPECSGLEPGAFVGSKTGSVVEYALEHYADERGFLHCARCGLVWRAIMALPEQRQLSVNELPPQLFAENRFDADPGFNPRQSDDVRYFRNLARLHGRSVTKLSSAALRSACGRVYDAEAAATALDLPPEITAAIVHHIKTMSERADLSILCRAPRGQQTIRSETIVVATVALVMERFQIERPGGIEELLDSFRFTRGNPSISPEEYDAAYQACAAWFGRALWRDGPEDGPEAAP